MKNKTKYLTLGFLVVFLISIPIGYASAAYSAADLLGQLDDNNQPVYTQGFPNNGNGIDGFNYPNDVAIDSVHHRLFVADTGNYRVLVFNLEPDNTLLDRVPDYVLGEDTFLTRIYGFTQNQLSEPSSLVYDSVYDRLFVADGARVMVFDTTSITNGEDAVNVLGQDDFDTFDCDWENQTADRLCYISGLAYDADNSRLFVADSTRGRLLVFDVGAITNGEDAVNVLGQDDLVSGTDCDYENPTADTFCSPNGLAYDSDNSRLFVPDQYYNRVLVFDVEAITNGEDAVNVLGQDDFVTSGCGDVTQASLCSPRGIVYHAVSNRLFIPNSWTRITVFDVEAITDGEDAISVLGEDDFVTETECEEDNVASQDNLCGVFGLAYDLTNDYLYAVDQYHQRIMLFDVEAITDGEDAANVLGQTDSDGDPIYTTIDSNNTPPNSIGFNNPSGTVIDTTNHRLFVSDRVNHRVLVFNLDTNNDLIDRIADNVLGQTDFVTNADADCSDGVTENRFCSPKSLAYDSISNRLFVADSDNFRILVFDVESITNGEDAVNVLGSDDFETSDYYCEFWGGATADDFCFVMGDLSYDNTNNRLFAGDIYNSRVLVFDVASITNGEDAVNVLGQEDLTSGECGEGQSGLCYWPLSLDFDSTNNRLFVGDSSRILVFDVASITNGEDAVNVLGQDDFDSDDCAPYSADGLCTAISLEYDSINNQLFVSNTDDEEGSSIILVFDVEAITNGEAAVDVIGQDSFTAAEVQVTQDGIGYVNGLTHDPTNDRLYVIDDTSSRIMIFDFAEETSSSGSYTNRTPSTSPGLPYIPPTSLNPANPGQPSTPGAGNPSNPSNPKTGGAPLIAPVQQFLRNLSFGSVGEDVKRLQQFLNLNEYTLSSQGAGSPSQETTFFGPKTFQAVKTFQETFASAILTPLGLSQGTGFFGNATRGFVNSLFK